MSAKARPGEAFLSADAQAILRYAREHAPEPFTRQEIVDIAPGAAWDELARWPRTVAALDPIRELVRAGLIAEHGERPAKTGPRGRTYKLWRLADVNPPRTLAELLDALVDDTPCPDLEALAERRAALRDEILRRFGDR